MKLKAFRIQKYRCIQDSGWIEIHDFLALVGRNESGKSSILQALYRFNPHGDRQNAYSLDFDWPRSDFGRRSGDFPVCSCQYELNGNEIKELSEHFEYQFPDTIEVNRLYNGNYRIPIAANLSKAVRPALLQKEADRLPSAASLTGKLKTVAETALQDLRSLILRQDLTQLTNKDQLLVNLIPTPGQDATTTENEIKFINEFKVVVNDLPSRISTFLPMPDELEQDLIRRIPACIYMSDYTIFTGTADLGEVKKRKDDGQLTESDKTFLMMLSLAELDLDQLLTPARVVEQIKLQAASQLLTDLIRTHYDGRKYTVEFRRDGNVFMTAIRDNINGALIELSERSKGFQWFFSFDLLFMHKSKSDFKNCVVLLDEPGIHLHPDRQADLLNLFKDYAKFSTVIYTTHLPFMLDLTRPETIRLQEQMQGAVNIETRGVETYDMRVTRSALAAALGIKGSHSLIVTERNLVVEGPDDFWIITEFSHLLTESGEQGLPDDIRIMPGKGSCAVNLSIFMFLQGLTVVTLFDADDGGRQEAEHLQKKWLDVVSTNGRLEIVLLDQLLGESRQIAIEDLFPDKYYFDAAKEAYPAGPSFETSLPEPHLPFYKRVEKYFKRSGIRQYEKSQVSRVLRSRLRNTKNISDLPELLQRNIRAVISGLNQRFAGNSGPTLVQKAAGMH